MTFKNLEKIAPFVFIGPAVIILFLIVIFPMVYSIGISLSEWNLMRGGNWKFVGLRNYYYTFFQDPDFYTSLKVTLEYVGVAVGLELLLGLGVALLLNRPLKKIGIMRTILVIPTTMTPVVVGIIWRLLYNPELGVLNYFLELFGFQKLNWLGDPNLALPSVIMADIWEWTPFMALILLAGLQSLPKEPFEASIVDGASYLQLFRYITFPLLLPTLIVALLLRVMDAFKTFDLIFVITGGGPAHYSETLNIYTYLQGFNFMKISYASTLAIVMFVILSIISMYLSRIYRQAEF